MFGALRWTHLRPDRFGPASFIADWMVSGEAEQCEKMEVDDDDEISGTPKAAGIRTLTQSRGFKSSVDLSQASGSLTGSIGFGDFAKISRRYDQMIKEIEKSNAKLKRFKTELTKKQDKMEQIINESVAVRRARFAEPLREPSQIKVNYNAELLWKIEGFQRKRQDAINSVQTALYSPPFYTSEFGSKMCAKMYMNGDDFGKGTHLSLFFVVMRGEYDALQTWPMQKKFTVILLDQGNGDHKIDVFHSDPQNSSFQRPTSDMNIAFCSPLFMNIPLDSLNDHQYIKDDVMFIRIIVE